MNIFICLLRGINVSGKNIIKMDELKKAFIKLKFTHVTTFIQSGNIVFKSHETDIKTIEINIEDLIKNNFGLNIPAIVIAKTDFINAEANNFLRNKYDNFESFGHLVFLKAIPKKELIQEFNKQNFAPDDYYINQSLISLYCPNGYARTKLVNTLFDKKLQTISTVRNYKTYLKLVGLLNDIEDIDC